jgi:hypothetical protein
MEYPPSQSDIDQLLDLRKLMRQVLDTEPGHHPEIPETIHRLLKAMLTTLTYVTNMTEIMNHELAQHKLDQGISEAALLRIFFDLGVFAPETYHGALIQATEDLGQIDTGKA